MWFPIITGRAKNCPAPPADQRPPGTDKWSWFISRRGLLHGAVWRRVPPQRSDGYARMVHDKGIRSWVHGWRNLLFKRLLWEEMRFLSVPESLAAMRAAGMASVRDLLFMLPRRYEDRRMFDRYDSLSSGVPVCLRGRWWMWAGKAGADGRQGPWPVCGSRAGG